MQESLALLGAHLREDIAQHEADGRKEVALACVPQRGTGSPCEARQRARAATCGEPPSPPAPALTRDATRGFGSSPKPFARAGRLGRAGLGAPDPLRPTTTLHSGERSTFVRSL